MEELYKEVYFDKYCPTCKHENEEDYGPHCNECLNEPAREYSHKPLKWEEKDNA